MMDELERSFIQSSVKLIGRFGCSNPNSACDDSMLIAGGLLTFALLTNSHQL